MARLEQLNIDIEPELHKQFIHKCLDVGKTKRDVIIQFIKDFIKKK